MREAAGNTLKSSISHTWTRDTRDDKLAATRGSYAKFFHEFAGLGGDAKFYKAEAEAQLSRPILDGVVRV
jgi:outer membrane protein insertion porin family